MPFLNTTGRIGPAPRSEETDRPLTDMQKRQILGMNQWIISETPGKYLVQMVKTLVTAQQRRLWNNASYMSIYANTDFMAPMSNVNQDVRSPMPRMAYNVVKLCTDSLTGKLIQGNSRVSMLVNEGSWKDSRKARKIEAAIEAEWRRAKFYQEAARVATDAINVGTGWLKMYIADDGKCIDVERVYPNEVFVDEQEAAFGKPTKLYQMRYMTKDSLVALYPDKAEIIMKAATAQPPRFGWALYSPGMVEVCEGWALPVGNRKGRHVIGMTSGELLDEEWDECFFPLIPFRAADMPFGWYGQGYVEQVMGAQIALSRLINIMEMGAKLGIAPYWVVPEGSGINIKHLNNTPGHIVETTGEAPQWVTNPPFHPEAVQYASMLEGFITQFYGMSSMETTGQSPVDRLDSKPALRAFEDMSQTRHTMLLDRWEAFTVDCAERTIMLAGQIAKAQGSYPVMTAKTWQNGMSLDWSDLSLKKDAYVIQPAPANFLSNTVAGRLQNITDIQSTGLVSQAQAQKMLKGAPDVDALLNEATASEEDIDRLIEQFIDGEYRAPSSLQNLPRALIRIKDSRLQFANQGAPEKILNLFDRYLSEASDLIQSLEPSPQTTAGITNGNAAASPGVTTPNGGGTPPPAGTPAQ